MGLRHARRQAIAAHGKTVVHRRDFHLAGREVLDRMVGAMMPLVHLLGRATERETEQLMTKADAEDGLTRLHQLLDRGHRILPCCRRIAWSVAEEDAVRLVREDVL